MIYLKAAILIEIAVCCYGFLLSSVLHKRQVCSYAEISADHTMCISSDVGKAVAVDASAKKEIVDRHNKLRSEVTPAASGMVKMVWDDELAKIAEKWAKQCKFGHDNYKKRATKAYPSVFIGQNGAFDTVTWTEAIDEWYSEKKSFVHGKGSKDGGVIGHYTQVVNDNAVRVGCGRADCPPGSDENFQKTTWFCNYARGQLTSEFPNPYSLGTPCSSCSGNCDQSLKLCDCGGKICQNDGTMQYDTCTCKCSALYTGADCTQVNCKADEASCPLYQTDWCTVYANIPEECPHKCGLC
ncbi:hypothetical protein LOTGIDRAFT_203268 [Lottia gigantea]|uniref:SCP domain-containing protein n=1 Tax=Lottia gigantea TaxID=225164 RepID=V4B6J8_LOTGI|nr:hypothetical protein LOTGIDRAFT_203268 [Lottia gigantea]ESO84184.1 hypothetical protein LOTGIDRAFT_203268 [Lottia gigantea]